MHCRAHKTATLNPIQHTVRRPCYIHTYFNQRVLQPRPRGVAKEKEMKKQKETEKKDEQSLLHE